MVVISGKHPCILREITSRECTGRDTDTPKGPINLRYSDLKAQQQLPDIHVPEAINVLPDLADEFGAAGDFGELFDALLP